MNNRMAKKTIKAKAKALMAAVAAVAAVAAAAEEGLNGKREAGPNVVQVAVTIAEETLTTNGKRIPT